MIRSWKRFEMNFTKFKLNSLEETVGRNMLICLNAYVQYINGTSGETSPEVSMVLE